MDNLVALKLEDMEEDQDSLAEYMEAQEVLQDTSGVPLRRLEEQAVHQTALEFREDDQMVKVMEDHMVLLPLKRN